MNRRPTLEEETFRRCALRKEQLEPFGFARQKDVWRYSEPFMNGAFRAEVYVRDDGQVYGRVMESDLDEEYLGLRLPNPTGYPAQVREEYLAVLRRIAEGCFERQDFVFPQSNRIASLILQRYGIRPEFLWEKTPEGLVTKCTEMDADGNITSIVRTEYNDDDLEFIDPLNDHCIIVSQNTSGESEKNVP